MSAQDNLGPQFPPGMSQPKNLRISVARIGRLRSGDWEIPMNQVHAHPTLGDQGRLQGPPRSSGGSRRYSMADMTADVAANGVHSPIQLGRKYYDPEHVAVTEGHHRYVAARDAGLRDLPVELIDNGLCHVSVDDVLHDSLRRKGPRPVPARRRGRQ